MSTPASAPMRDPGRKQERDQGRESGRNPAPEPLRQVTPERILLRLDWQVIRRLDGLLQGDYRSIFYGYGVDFADLREYQPGDDIRYIDWNVTARMDTPYIRQYVEDREITAWFLLDLSPSMDFGTVQTLKRTQLIDFVATVARLLTRHGNRVGAILYTGRTDTRSGASGAQDLVPARPTNGGRSGQQNANPGGTGHPGRVARTIPARGGRIQVLSLVNDLLKYSAPPAAEAPKGRQQKTPRGPTDLSVLFGAGLHTIKRRSLVFAVSDFASVPGWERPLNLLAQHHEVLAVRLWDPRELELPDIGLVIMEDAETGEQLYVDTHDRKFRRRFQEAAQAREEAIAGAFRRAGIDALSLSTEDDLVRAIVRFATLRRRQR
ncbi:MAG: DUF58 domain-containing protein [Caldilineaceae bacterium]